MVSAGVAQSGTAPALEAGAHLSTRVRIPPPAPSILWYTQREYINLPIICEENPISERDFSRLNECPYFISVSQQSFRVDDQRKSENSLLPERKQAKSLKRCSPLLV
jgi:hypothetical protein